MPVRPAKWLLMLCGLLMLAEPAAGATPSLLLGKPEQRSLGIRTLSATAARQAEVLAARVIVDPRRQHRISAGEDGVIEAPEGGFIAPGSGVAQGSVLAWLRPVIAEPQRRDLQAQLATAQRDVALGKLQIKRFSIDEAQAVEGNLLTPSIRITADYHAAQARVAHLERTLNARSAIRAPAAGTLLRSALADGQLVRGGEALGEIAGAAQTVIAAPIAAAQRARIAQAAAALAGDAQALSPLGLRFDAVSRSWQALYAQAPDATPLLAGAAVRVVLAAGADSPIRVPADSLFEHEQRQWLWLHEGPEQFVAQAVDVVARDVGSVAIRGDWAARQRIVIVGGGALTARLKPRAEPAT